jgi:DNA polymerase-3 subunit epsilon
VDLRGLKLSAWTPPADDLAAHERYLDGLDKEVKGACVWRTEPAPPAAPAA